MSKARHRTDSKTSRGHRVLIIVVVAVALAALAAAAVFATAASMGSSAPRQPQAAAIAAPAAQASIPYAECQQYLGTWNAPVEGLTLTVTYTPAGCIAVLGWGTAVDNASTSVTARLEQLSIGEFRGPVSTSTANQYVCPGSYLSLLGHIGNPNSLTMKVEKPNGQLVLDPVLDFSRATSTITLA